MQRRFGVGTVSLRLSFRQTQNNLFLLQQTILLMPSIIGKATSTFSLSSMKKKTDDDLQVEFSFLLLPL